MAPKRRLGEETQREKVKQLRISIERAYKAMDLAVSLIEGVGVTGNGQASTAEKIAAMQEFENTMSNARRCLEDLETCKNEN